MDSAASAAASVDPVDVQSSQKTLAQRVQWLPHCFAGFALPQSNTLLSILRGAQILKDSGPGLDDLWP